MANGDDSYNDSNELPDNALTIDTGSSDDPSEEETLQKNHRERMSRIRARHQVMETFWSPIHQAGREDDRMRAGKQWPEQLRADREEEHRPCLTYNLYPAFGRQIINRIRENPNQVKILPVDTGRGKSPMASNVDGTKDYALADVYSGIFRNIEHVSRAQQAYEHAVSNAVDHGFGYFMMMPQWSRDDPFIQELIIKRVKDSYAVMLDPDVEECDYRDARDAFLSYKVNKTTFEAKYPDVNITELSNQGGNYSGWYDTDSVRVAQYFYLEYIQDEVAMLSTGKTVYLSEVKDVLDDMKREEGTHILKGSDGKEMKRPVKRPVCKWLKCTADEILEEATLPFSGVPIFPVFGDEVILEDEVIYESAFRHAHDAQRSYNYWRTAAAEAVALAPKAPWVLTDRQIAGHEPEWESANNTNQPYLVYNHVDGVPPPQRQYPTSMAAAELQNATQDAIDMQTIIGLHDASLGREGNEKSGKAIQARVSQGNTATFQFPDNLVRAMEQMVRLAIEAIPKIYDTQRIVRLRTPDDREDFVEINQAVRDSETGKINLVNDIAYGKYDGIIDTGPSYATLRQEAADLQMELLRVLGPEKASNIVHLVVENMAVPGSDEVAAVLRKMLPDSLKTQAEIDADLPKGVTRDEASGQLVKDGQPWQPPMTPQQQLMQKQQEIDELEHKASLKKSEATMAKAEADMAEAQAELQQLRTEVAALQQGIADQEAAAQAEEQQFQQLLPEIEKIIKQSFAEHEANPRAHGEATSQQIEEAVVDTLQRVKKYVNRAVNKPTTATPEI